MLRNCYKALSSARKPSNDYYYSVEACNIPLISVLSKKKVWERLPGKHKTRYKLRLKAKDNKDTCLPESVSTGITTYSFKFDEFGKRIKRRKVAMLLGYCGAKYHGMQKIAEDEVATIEGELFKALLQCKYINQEVYEQMHLINYRKASRTDTGVSAARQLVAMDLPEDIEIDVINRNLPDCIRIFATKRARNDFDTQDHCVARTYTYTMPTFSLDSLVNPVEDDRMRYRIADEKIEALNGILKMYEGHQNFHNFTILKHFNDPSSKRIIKTFAVDKVFESKDMEFIVLKVKGQSFMMHQIRRMVGLAIGIMRGKTGLGIMTRAMSDDKVALTRAPGLGLVLDEVHYDRYNRQTFPGTIPLTWENVEEDVEQFKQDHIYPTIINTELTENPMGLWLHRRLANHDFKIEASKTAL